jgi:uncharacterized protein (DUF2141 family)
MRPPHGLAVTVATGLALMATALAAQNPPRDGAAAAPRPVGTGTISGVVLNDATGLPLRRASIILSRADNVLRLNGVTEDTGAFVFNNLPDGRYALAASKPGFVAMSYGAKRAQRPGTSIALAAGQQRAGITMRLAPGGVITGTVRNRNGEPMIDARIAVLRQSFGYDTGERTLSSIAGLAGASPLGVPTDDRGMFRVYGLPSDDYFVLVSQGVGIRGDQLTRAITADEVSWAMRQLQSPGGSAIGLTPPPPAGAAVDYAPVFYPGVPTQANATMVSLKAGEERAGVDILYDMTPMARISGTVVNPGGALPGNLQINVVAHDTIPGIPFSGFGNARADATGRFLTGGLPPGDYTITVRLSGVTGRGGPTPATAAALFGISTVSLNGADVDTTITLDSGVTVSGRLVFDGTTQKPPADLTRVRVTLTPARSRVPALGVNPAVVDATGAFTFAGVTPGRYRLSAAGAGNWLVRAATMDGRDALDDLFEVGRADLRNAEIRLTDQPTEISGDLLDGAGQPATDYFIVVFAADKAHWVPQSRWIQSVRPASDGKFKVPNLPAGDYYIAAVTDVEQGEWYNPEFLAQLVPAGTKITLGEGEKKVQSLRIK